MCFSLKDQCKGMSLSYWASRDDTRLVLVKGIPSWMFYVKSERWEHEIWSNIGWVGLKKGVAIYIPYC